MSEVELSPSKRLAVLGAGVEGRAVIAYLRSLGCRDITVCDADPAIELDPDLKSQLGDDYLQGLDRFDAIFRSPGVPRDLAGLLDAERAGVAITSATKEFLRRVPCTVVGITGSNGKTTTTALVAALLRTLYGDSLHVGGNDGEALLAALPRIQRDHVVVLELSSFQLQDLTQSPNVSVVLNITPNHLDVHPTMDQYIAAKAEIVRHQTPADYAVLNWAYTRVREFAQLTPARVVNINHADAEEGAFLREGKMVLRHDGQEHTLLAAEALPLLTNIDNVLAAASVARLFGIDVDVIRQTVLEFRGVAHRMELVRELAGVRYYDDSASTTPDSTINALRSFAEGKVVLIAGGTDKRLSYDMMAKEILRTATRCLFIGQTRKRLADAVSEVGKRLKHEAKVEICTTLEEAVAAAQALARPGDAIVLSPGCASFDMFRNAKHRGERFQEIVQGL